MVTPMLRARRGGSTFGCLVTLLLFAAAVYYAIPVGEVYLRYYRLLDAMHFQASLARSIDDQTITRNLTATADSLLGQTPRFHVTRRGTPMRTTIQTEYTERVELPFFKRTITLHPRVEDPRRP
jgi:hypothetical protein